MPSWKPLTSLLIAFAALAPVSAQTDQASDLASCEAMFAAAPNEKASFDCFHRVGFGTPLAEEAENRLRRHLAEQPNHPWLLLYIGHFLLRDPERAEPMYRQAAASCAAYGVAECEVLARANLQRILDARGEVEEAGRQAEQAERVAEKSGNVELIARARMVRARHLYLLGQDLERVYLLLRQAEEVAFPDGPYALRRETISWLGDVSLELGRYREAQEYFQRFAELAAREKDSFAEASARYSLARAFLDGIAEAPRPGDKAEAIALLRQALAKADEARNSTMQARSHWLLSLLLSGTEAEEHLDLCLQVADTVRDRRLCLNALTRHLSETNPRRAREVSQEALALAHQAEDSWGMAHVWRERMRASWISGPRKQAIADAHAALEAIETLRDQGGATSRVGFFSSWSDDYSWFSGRLLEAWSAGHDPSDLEEAFEAMERKRARALLDALAAAQAAPVQPASLKPLQERLSQVHEDISRVQRQLLDPDLPAGQRTAAQADLKRLELEEQVLRNRIDEASPALTALRAPSFARLAQVREALAPDEALLSYQIALDQDVFGNFAGGSWIVVSTRGGTRAWRLHRDRVALRPAIELFDGLFARRDGSEAGPAAGLYRELLADAVGSLPPGIRRLVIIPDDVLHQLPFAALRASADAEPLIVRYEISVVPSATLWLHWREQERAPAPAPLLALADPLLSGGGDGFLPQPAVARERLGSLPFARREGRSALRQLGGESLLQMGEAASEGFLKSADLRRFSILHFATHAVLDDQNPERSGVLLTPAPASEDGLLQIREIVPLSLDGRVVVAASCRSASGTVLRGEGVMGLARAFFQAGAPTVVANLWPLRDDDGAALFERFYHHLAQGKSVAGALRAAQLDRLADGAPGYAWAGLLVLGEGNLVPMPGGRSERPIPVWIWAALGGGALLLAGLILAWYRRHSRKMKSVSFS